MILYLEESGVEEAIESLEDEKLILNLYLRENNVEIHSFSQFHVVN